MHDVQRIHAEGWHVNAATDADGHLTVWITHDDGTPVRDLNVELQTDNIEWVERFTTEKIERDYHKEQGYA